MTKRFNRRSPIWPVYKHQVKKKGSTPTTQIKKQQQAQLKASRRQTPSLMIQQEALQRGKTAGEIIAQRERQEAQRKAEEMRKLEERIANETKIDLN